jgi:predicted nuclease of predicted toxin-antitoxin system
VKALLDQNISYRLVNKIISLFPETEQVKRLGLENKPDREIWDFAKKEDYSIVTFDSDFYDMSLLLGYPAKVIWLKLGNTTTNNFETIFLHLFGHFVGGLRLPQAFLTVAKPSLWGQSGLRRTRLAVSHENRYWP